MGCSGKLNPFLLMSVFVSFWEPSTNTSPNAIYLCKAEFLCGPFTVHFILERRVYHGEN